MEGAFCLLIEIRAPHVPPFDRAITGLLHAGTVEHEDTAGRFIEDHDTSGAESSWHM